MERGKWSGAKNLESLPPLEVFENPKKDRVYTIEFTCPEWTAVCPMTGFPDFGTIYITYDPLDFCVELKSLKLYINAYRNIGIFHEAAVNRILDDFVRYVKPRRVNIVGDFNVRGNIKTVVKAQYHLEDD